MSADEYVPEEDDVRMAYIEAHVSMVDPITRHQLAQAEREAEDAWTAFLARVRRDAVREALLALDRRIEPLAQHQDADGIWTAQGEIADMLTNDYPEEAP